ncbi:MULTISPECIES: hypothetical protein [Caproicibacterium]|jgi:hypothetical protein|uniref:Uncharacterized protein n=1 Tax=Caproicibacterium lactatifermentans TaxID=2666138 RepID=A0A859DQB0_9FIRM|nr:hypothetical protein [Caproicibacterium lactatifermentans]ARP50289.1 hypothetical protein B6259_04995 [Ruminococcaceae bacterium CPB6]QKN23990.1 hypothetical protein GJQ69_05540 [Caproicibacterium lactatifermentans]QKO30939.1 hypothetical protein GKP14_08000 [Caproicibacterium lactatifermentans]
MKEEKRVLWRVRLVLCMVVLLVALIVRFAVGGKTYADSKIWYTGLLQNSVLPDSTAKNLQKKFVEWFPQADFSKPVLPQQSSHTQSDGGSSKGKSASSVAANSKKT